MKKTNVKRIVLFALASLLLIAAFAALGVSAADEATPNAEIVSNNLYYGDTLRLVYAVYTENAEGYDLSVDIYDDEYNWICTAVNGASFDEQIGDAATIDGKQCRVFVMPAGVPAQDINKKYTAVPKLTKGSETIECEAREYSVLEYLYERLFVTEDVEDAKKDMYRKLISYADVADTILDGTPEGERISDYTYVCVKDGTIDGQASQGVYKIGDTVYGSLFDTTLDIPAGSGLSWQIETYDILTGDKKSSELVSDSDIGDITLTKNALIVTPKMTSKAYTLVTDISQLKNGAQIIIAACNYDVALSTDQRTNNRGQADIIKSGNTVTFGEDVQIITLTVTSDGKYNLQVGEKYLGSAGKASSGNNYLKSLTSVNENSTFDISISSEGVATIISNGATTNNYLRYNKASNSKLFSCYASANTQEDVCIYVLE